MSARMGTLLRNVFLMQVLSLTVGYPNGATSSSCADMIPRHSGVQPQPSPAPYSIQTSSHTFQPGQPITVVLLSSNTQSSPLAVFCAGTVEDGLVSSRDFCKFAFRAFSRLSQQLFHIFRAIKQMTIKGPDYTGVLLEARMESTVNALGTWQSPPANTKFLHCSGNQRSAITHSNTNVKDNSTVYSWLPPSGIGSIYFMATVARQRTAFWLNVKSDTLTKGAAAGGVGSAAEPVLWAKAGLLFLVPSFLFTLLCSS
ncbi:hypothetical protein SKAU_G00273570 [Synaphobranchus kaupii]|uniref:Reelin domain-containing protein n=1 Tax=Synaphobranchus kaupii TaxID=118154 RepID=A0A9Q1F0T2_SYNKA|nr:hypothetical protein SKAU_G00273570 [Synaphobranchus kaupii]